MDTQVKVIMLIFAGIILIYLLYNRTSENFVSEKPNENNLPENMETYQDTGSKPLVQNEDGTVTAPSTGENPIPREEMLDYFPKKDYSPPESDWLASKFRGRNKARPGEYKKSSYNEGIRGDLGAADWDAYFDTNNNVLGNSQTGDNDKFLPLDETNNEFAVFKSKGRASCGSNQNCEPEDLFDVDKYLPQEVNDDWFEVQPEPISVKNRHLINITKPIGINTIGSSKKNASYDLRAAPVAPKNVVSPWLQSSIEPDTNLKPLF